MRQEGGGGTKTHSYRRDDGMFPMITLRSLLRPPEGGAHTRVAGLPEE